ncbi:MAG: lasso peptide isopeptide bond-forming cyclase [Rhodothermales bacterium]
MSAVAGLYLLDGRAVDRATPARMIGTMPHRSPDGSAVWTGGAVGLAHGAFHTTPESLHEVLPLTNEAGTLTITADARIDNRDELIAWLALPNRPEPIADSELILAAYEAWGERCLDRLVGDFAFAIWDARQRALFCARDYVGTRPLYYYYEPGQIFAFGSEVKAILTLDGVPEDINEVKVADYLSWSWDDVESTLYEGVLRLPHAHALRVDAHGIRKWKYYELRPVPSAGCHSDADYTERFRELFTEAVRCRLRSAFPVASQLSGGLDSSAVSCVARDILLGAGRGELHTISLVFDEDQASDERSYISAVLEQGGFVPHFVPGDTGGPLSDLDEIYGTLDSELISGNPRLVWVMLQEARRRGVRVLLDGLDGDNVISHGYLRLKELVDADDWEAFADEATQLVARFKSADHMQEAQREMADPKALARVFGTYGVPRLRAYAEEGAWTRYWEGLQTARRAFSLKRGPLLRRHWRYLLAPAWLLKLWRASKGNGSGSVSGAQVPPPLLSRQFAERIRHRERLAEFEGLKSNAEGVRESQREVLGGGKLAIGLELGNLCASAQHVEIRHPFMDRRLVEFCLSLPSEFSLRNGWTRFILRQALVDVLPERIAWRTGKGNMVPTFTPGLFERNDERLREHVTDLGPLAEFVDTEAVRRMYERGAELGELDQVRLAAVATMSFWLKRRREPSVDTDASASEDRNG